MIEARTWPNNIFKFLVSRFRIAFLKLAVLSAQFEVLEHFIRTF